ncbi:MAG: 3-deoxy-manno-octulosonate-8-phosphatase KdsC [Xanthomonadales bacterium]|nr:3-deoxy-manno-octulosonate-8-phosphatase KdsC [Xanthomonadales bacterium]
MNAGQHQDLDERAARIRLLALDVDGVLTDGRLWFDQTGNELKAFYTRDGLGLKALLRFGVAVALITGRTSRMVDDRAAQLGIQHVYQGRDDKLNALEELMSETGVEAGDICYVGDDWIDLPVLERVGLSVSPSDAAPLVRERVHWVTAAKGGLGAVREVCDFILAAQGHDQQLMRELLDR